MFSCGKQAQDSKSSNYSCFSLTRAVMQSFCLWCLCFFQYSVTALSFMILVCVEIVTVVLQSTLFHLKQAVLQGMVPDVQEKLLRSFLYFENLSLLRKITPIEI